MLLKLMVFKNNIPTFLLYIGSINHVVAHGPFIKPLACASNTSAFWKAPDPSTLLQEGRITQCNWLPQNKVGLLFKGGESQGKDKDVLTWPLVFQGKK